MSQVEGCHVTCLRAAVSVSQGQSLDELHKRSDTKATMAVLWETKL